MAWLSVRIGTVMGVTALAVAGSVGATSELTQAGPHHPTPGAQATVAGHHGLARGHAHHPGTVHKRERTEKPVTSDQAERREAPEPRDNAEGRGGPPPKVGHPGKSKGRAAGRAGRATPVGPDAAGPAAHGLCTAASHGGLGRTSVARRNLVAAAAGATIAAYCTHHR